jgi:hypothetical protein
VAGLGPVGLHRARTVLRTILWGSALALVASILTCAVFDDTKIDWVRGPGWRLYIGQGYISWIGWDGGTKPGLYIRDRSYGIGIGDGGWFGVDPFDVEYMAIPTACLSLGPILIAGMAIIALRLLRRCVAPGHCVYCAYNLAGNVTGVCPECGHAIYVATGTRRCSGSSRTD